nr:hypothetical protein [Candidatus Freyarchaeota archaeon]
MIKYPDGREDVKNTPYIVITSWFPAHKTPEVTKTYLESLEKYPPDEDLSEHVVTAAVTTNKFGIKVMDIYKVKQGKLEEHLTRSSMAMAMFHSIEGYEYSVRVWLTIEEAMAAVGQQ